MTAARQYHSHLLRLLDSRFGNCYEHLRKGQEDPEPRATFVTSSSLRLPTSQALTMGAVDIPISSEQDRLLS